MLASLTIALGLAVAGGPPYGGTPSVVPPPIPANPVAGMRVPAHALAGHAAPIGPAHHGGDPNGFILPPGPGDGWGFPNDAPDGYGWYDPGVALPIREDRTTSYYFRRYMAVPAPSMFLPSYYNPFITRGQRYIPYTGMGGHHAAGGAPTGSATTAVTPYDDLTRSAPRDALPEFSGEVQAAPVNSGQGRLVRD